jgi:hypothetical protein
VRSLARGNGRSTAAVVVALAGAGCLSLPEPGGGDPDAQSTTCAGLALDRAAPRAHWPLDDGAGTVASDVVGDHDGVVLGGEPTWVDGVVGGGALELDGVDDRVAVADAATFAPGAADFTLAVWARTTSAQEAAIFSRQACASTGEHIWHLAMWGDGRPYYRLGDGNELALLTSTAVINDGSWHHLAAVFERDGDGILYVDGIATGSLPLASIDPIEGALDIHLGALNPCDGLYPWRGGLDDARFYDRALAACEVNELADVVASF